MIHGPEVPVGPGARVGSADPEVSAGRRVPAEQEGQAVRADPEARGGPKDREVLAKQGGRTARASTEGRAGQNVDMRPVDAGAAAILAPDLAIVTIGMQKNLSAVRVIVDQMFSSRSSKPVPAGNYSQQNAMLRSLRKVVVPITMSTDTWEDRSRILRAATLAGGYLPRTSHSKMSR